MKYCIIWVLSVLAEINELVTTEGAKAASDDNDSDSETKGKARPASKCTDASLSSSQQEWTFEEDEDAQETPAEPLRDS